MTDISALAPLADDEPPNYLALIASCGKFVDAWLDAGGEPTDEPIAGFYTLWAQSLDLPASAGQEEEASYYKWALPYFIRYRDEVREALRAAATRA